MKCTVELKYSKGDKVSLYKNYKDNIIPDECINYTIDGYRIQFTENEPPKISYVFHCYLDKYVDYHELINEDSLSPIGECHPHAVEVDVKDVFGDDVNIGDYVYHGLYHTNHWGG